MRKTLLVTLDFYPQVGGISGYWEQLGMRIPSQKWVVLAPRLPSGMQELSTPYRIYRRRLCASWVHPSWLPLIFHILGVARRENIEHIIIGQILPIGTVVMFLSFFTKIPYTVSCHGMDILGPQHRARKKFLCKKIFLHAHSIIANSLFTAQQLGAYGLGAHTATIVYPCPIITPDFLKKDHSLHDSHPILLTVARLVKRKGHAIILDALPQLLARFPSLEYCIIGSGSEQHVLQEQAIRGGYGDHVKFLGVLTQSQTAAWFSRCTIFAMTPIALKGDLESFGIVYLEANGFGKSVIATRCGGISEAVLDGVTGVLMPPGDPNAFADAVLHLLGDPEYATRLGEQGKQRVAHDFQWSVQAKKLIHLLSA